MKIFASLLRVAIAPLAALVIAQPAPAQYAGENFCQSQEEFFDNSLVDGWCWGSSSREVSTLVSGRLAVSASEASNGDVMMWAWFWHVPGVDPMLVSIRVAPDGHILRYNAGSPRDLSSVYGHFNRAWAEFQRWQPE